MSAHPDPLKGINGDLISEEVRALLKKTRCANGIDLARHLEPEAAEETQELPMLPGKRLCSEEIRLQLSQSRIRAARELEQPADPKRKTTRRRKKRDG